jgi:hypothetical protein
VSRVGSRAHLLHKFQGAQFKGSAATSAQKNQTCKGQKFLGPNSHTGFRELSSVQNQACWLAPSVTCGAGDPRVLLAQGHRFPWSFSMKVAGLVLGGAGSSEFLCVLGSRTYCQGTPSDGAWSPMVISGRVGDPEC